jgi:hypothetical protein
VDQRNAVLVMPCVPVMNARDGKAGAMAIHRASTVGGALLNAITMKTLVSSQTVPVGLAQDRFLTNL